MQTEKQRPLLLVILISVGVFLGMAAHTLLSAVVLASSAAIAGHDSASDRADQDLDEAQNKANQISRRVDQIERQAK